MKETWTLEKINHLISNQEQENLYLEYKAAAALEKTDAKKLEVTKDVSAMANSAGGTIIYGVKEYSEEDKKHLPESLDPIDQSKYTKEWLEQVIKNIRPKIDGVIIHPITFNTNKVLYVVEIPKSDTAHQANDFRYHKRYNFTISAMEDHEVRDVMGRNKNPKFEFSFKLVTNISYEKVGLKTINWVGGGKTYEDNIVEKRDYSINVTVRNISSVYALYVNAFFLIPKYIANYDDIESDDIIDQDGVPYLKRYYDNTVREMVDFLNFPKYGPARYDPILPGLTRTWILKLKDLRELLPQGHFVLDEKIKWTIHADNAIPISGELNLSEIELKVIKGEPPHG